MSREMYGGGGGSSQRSPKSQRRDMQQQSMGGGGQGSPSKNIAVGPMMTSRASPHSQMAPSSVGVRSGLSSPQSRIKPTRHVSGTRSSTNSPLTIAGEPTTNSTHFPHSLSGSAFNIPGGSGAYYDELGSPVMMDSRSASAPGHHRSRSVGRSSAAFRTYHSLERDPEREFIPIRDPSDRSLERGGGGMGMMDGHHQMRRSDDGRSYIGSRDPGTLYDDDPYRVHGRQSPYNPGDSIISSRHQSGSNMSSGMMGGGGMSRSNVMDTRGDVVSRANMMESSRGGGGGGDPYARDRDRDREAYIFELQTQLAELQKDFSSLKKELEVTNQKLGSSMHSIKTFWSPELKKERALRKEESAKYALINDQLKLLNSENQKQATLIQQLEEELRSSQLRNPVIDLQPQLENIYSEKEHQAKEIYLLRETIKELELRIDTQKQTLHARDESIKKLLEMLQGKSSAVGKLLDEDRIEYEKMKTQLYEAQSRARHLETLLETKDKDIMKTKEVEELKVEISRRDQEIMAMGAKMRTLEEQHQDYQRHIAVLKESLTAKEEHYNMLQTDVEELRQRLEEKNKLIEKKTQQMIQAQQDRNRLNSELSEMKEHMDIKDRKINVLQRKIELHEANEKLHSKAKEGDAQVAQAQKQMEERQKAMDERQKILEEMEKRLKKRKEKLDQLENQMQKAEAGSNEVLAKQIADLRKKNDTQEKQALDAKKGLEKAKDDALRAQQDLDRLLQIMQQSEEEKFAKDKQIRDLQEALANVKKSQQAGAQMVTETVRQKDEEVKRETAKAQEQLHRQQERIAELEEALRESVQITAEREIAVAQAEEELIKAQGKIGKLEQRLKSVQNAHNLRCTNCPSLRASIKELEQKLHQLFGERRTHFEELFDMKQDALTAAISERDAHIALLEVSGIKTQKSSEELDRLKNERSGLMDKIRQENERRVVLLQNGSLSVEGLKQEVELAPNEISNGGTSSSSSSFSSCDEDWNHSQHDP